MKIYISGPMTGRYMYNFPAFDDAKAALVALGHEVVSPADMDRARGFDPTTWSQEDRDKFEWSSFPDKFDRDAVIYEDLAALSDCDAIFMLDGWWGSKGAQAERAVALWRRIADYSCLHDIPKVETISPTVPSKSAETHILESLQWAKDFAIENGRDGFAAWIRDLADRINKDLAGERAEGNFETEEIVQAEPVGNLHLNDATAYAVATASVMTNANPEDILEEALRITSGDRQASYGSPDQDFRRTAGIWSALFSELLRDGVKFEPFHVALAMIGLKASRQMHQRKRDNWVDLAGYSRCGQICDQEAAK